MPTSSDEPLIDVYWRRGCPYCMRLRYVIERDGIPTRWHDIWAEEGAAEFVRSVADGNETVPTVVVAGSAHVNPQPAELRSMIATAFPDADFGGSANRPNWWRRHFTGAGSATE
ncbi:MAG: glutaredoxin domain-containing protein [Sciscionella sp.]